MRRALGVIDAVSEWSGKIVSILILVMIAALLYEVIARYVFNDPTRWAHETSRQIYGAYIMLSGAYVLLQRQHIKIDVIYGLFSPRVRAGFDSITYLLFFLFIGVILVYGWQMAWYSMKVGETAMCAPFPLLFPVKMTIPLATFLMLLQGLAHFIRAVTMAIRGKELA